jgi:adenylosuccinate synthase
MTTIVCGLGFGDEGKGSITDFLVRESGARTVVRYNGGPQAGHNVVTDDGRWHCFAQLGAGSFVPGTRTVLGPQMVVELEALAAEAAVLASKGVDDPLARVVLDGDCTLVTPMHKLLGQLAELAARRGSCGMGVGEAVRWRDRGIAIRVCDLADGSGLAGLERLADAAYTAADRLLGEQPSAEMLEVYRYFRERCDARRLFERYREIAAGLVIGPASAALVGPVVFEGAQGALLDRTRGFVPFVTQARTTVHDAIAIRGGTRLGVTRAYHHRHGRGPFVTEDAALAQHLADRYNHDNRWQGPFRVGHLDLVALRYGIALNDHLDQLAITGLDRLAGLPELRACTSYEYVGELERLDRHFTWERLGPGRARVLAIGAPADLAEARMLAEQLAHCRPLDWITLDGFTGDLTATRALADLPASARRFVELIAREVAIPVGIVSVRPEASGKLRPRGI